MSNHAITRIGLRRRQGMTELRLCNPDGSIDARYMVASNALWELARIVRQHLTTDDAVEVDVTEEVQRDIAAQSNVIMWMDADGNLIDNSPPRAKVTS